MVARVAPPTHAIMRVGASLSCRYAIIFFLFCPTPKVWHMPTQNKITTQTAMTPDPTAKTTDGMLPAPACSPSSTPESSEAWAAVSRQPDGMHARVPVSEYAYAMSEHSKKMERQRNALAEALIEMRYSHTDKAERMAVAALAYQENVPCPATGGLTPETSTQQ